MIWGDKTTDTNYWCETWTKKNSLIINDTHGISYLDQPGE